MWLRPTNCADALPFMARCGCLRRPRVGRVPFMPAPMTRVEELGHLRQAGGSHTAAG